MQNGMALSQRPDVETMVAELQRLEREEREISAVRRKLHDRIDSFPSDMLRQRERQVSEERRELHRKIDVLRAELGLPGAGPQKPAP
jgi:hypothetical protein